MDPWSRKDSRAWACVCVFHYSHILWSRYGLAQLQPSNRPSLSCLSFILLWSPCSRVKSALKASCLYVPEDSHPRECFTTRVWFKSNQRESSMNSFASEVQLVGCCFRHGLNPCACLTAMSSPPDSFPYWVGYLGQLSLDCRRTCAFVLARCCHPIDIPQPAVPKRFLLLGMGRTSLNAASLFSLAWLTVFLLFIGMLIPHSRADLLNASKLILSTCACGLECLRMDRCVCALLLISHMTQQCLDSFSGKFHLIPR